MKRHVIHYLQQDGLETLAYANGYPKKHEISYFLDSDIARVCEPYEMNIKFGGQKAVFVFNQYAQSHPELFVLNRAATGILKDLPFKRRAHLKSMQVYGNAMLVT